MENSMLIGFNGQPDSGGGKHVVCHIDWDKDKSATFIKMKQNILSSNFLQLETTTLKMMKLYFFSKDSDKDKNEMQQMYDMRKLILKQK